MNLEGFYNKNYKLLMIIPIALFLISLVVIGMQYNETGDIIIKDVSLEGGISATVSTNNPIELSEIEEIIKTKSPKSDVFVRELSEFGSNKRIGILVEASEMEENLLKNILEDKLDMKLSEDNYSVEQAGGSLGESFYRQMLIAMVLAFILMAVVILITFRTIIPSIATVSAALIDITVAIGILDLFNVRIGTAGIAALLLLIGYSVDDNVLLTTKALKRTEGSLFARMMEAMKTGLSMTVTTITAVSIGYFVSSSYVLKEIFLIIFIGMLIDISTTYLLNTGILKLYLKRKHAD